MLFSKKPATVLWPKSDNVAVYRDLKENNTFSVDLNLWSKLSESEVSSLRTYLAQSQITQCTILVPDDVLLTKSFLYDSKIDSIDKNEVIGLAESFVQFKINPDAIEYNLVAAGERTIIQSRIFDQSKINHLKENLDQLGLHSYSFVSVSAAIAKVVSTFFDQEYFFLYPLNQTESTLLLARKDSVFLTANVKNNALDIQKIINYSNLYFSAPITKIYVPANKELEINTTTELNKTPYSETQIASELHQPSNLPLPVLGVFAQSVTPAVIIKPDNIHSTPPKTNMENKKNILPLIAVFVVTAAIASIIIWFVLNRNNTKVTDVSNDVTPTIDQTIPTDTPVPTAAPTVADISKKIKIQVLNSTDINGQAATLKAKLVGMGFTSVTVGNSKDKKTANELQTKASMASASAYFENKLAGYFDATVTNDLPASSNYDVVFNIGTDLSKGTAPPSADTTTTIPTPTKKTTTKVTPTATTSAAKVTPTKKLSPTPTE